jgi:hypothetical protein
MTMPGFTAETSLYTTYAARGHYEGMMAEAVTGGELVRPQQGGLAEFSFGCSTLLDRSFGPASVRLRACIFPPQACIRLCAFGACREFCVP